MAERRLRTKEKRKRSKLAASNARKGIGARILKLTFWFAAIALVLWALTGWYLGVKAEKVFKAYLQTHSEVVGEKLLRIELLSYRKKLFGAEAQLSLSSDVPLISEQVGEVAIHAKLLNGPLFITKRGVSIGSSRWFLKINEASLGEYERENIQAIFPKALPTAIVRTDFKQKAYYLARLQTNFAKALITGVYTLETKYQEEQNRGAITLNDFSFGSPPNTTVMADSVKISYQHQKAISASYKPGTTSMSIPVLTLTSSSFDKTLTLKLNARSNLSSKGNFLNGFLKLGLEQITLEGNAEVYTKNHAEKNMPFDTAELSLWFKGISADGLMAYSEANADLDNLKQQIDWTLEDLGEFPEGRDAIIHLYAKIESDDKKLNSVIIKEVFQDENSLLQLEFTAQQGDDKSYSKTLLRPVDKALLAGEMELDLSDDIQDFISGFLKEKEAKENWLSKKQIKLLFKDNKFHLQ
ncbi:MAG: DUF945 family protein [Cocleimonas sp.]